MLHVFLTFLHHISSFSPPDSPRGGYCECLIVQLGNWGRERLGTFPEVTVLENGGGVKLKDLGDILTTEPHSPASRLSGRGCLLAVILFLRKFLFLLPTPHPTDSSEGGIAEATLGCRDLPSLGQP